ncbi:hypothetical protein ERC79_21495 [Rhodococcus sp. ABRD24]|uniref:hypothetical protein n=1 Tax=Rhodococcus sp. ABRD24 TaxID=2507582 RepID=UPI00103D952E|nr:hypothetical protein [Rhodococcus sp. ABRD24]QBJ98229.1 hypothetical protein ERC79_21495 [Rhodococcus sp. ABRD24]
MPDVGSVRSAVRLSLAGVALTLAPLALIAAPAVAQNTGPGVLVAGAHFEPVCTPTDRALEELSGLAILDGKTYGIGDSGSDDAVVVMEDGCTVVNSITVPIDPYDVEDMGVGSDGRLWLADIGDNQRMRSTVALIGLDPATGRGQLHRLTYPDGPHDGESLLIQRNGVPLIVTKEVLAASGIYRPVGPTELRDLTEPGPTQLERVGSVRLGPTDTPGGLVPVGSSMLVTGGAVSADGTVAALRTYTDVYLYSAPDGDLARALTTTTPVRVALPNQPQGEVVAITRDGDLIAGSEAAGGPLPQIEILRGATELAQQTAWSGGSVSPSASAAAESTATQAAGGTTEGPGAATWSTPTLGVGALIVGLATFMLVRRRTRARQ